MYTCPECEKPLTHCTCRGANVINERNPDELENLTEEEAEELEEEYEDDEEEEWDGEGDDNDSDDNDDEE